MVRAWPRADGKLECDFRCWIPEAALDTAPPAARRVYEAAVEAETLIVLPGKVMKDYGPVEDWIDETAADWEVVRIGIDPNNAQVFADHLEENREYPVLAVPQYMRKLNAPSKRLSDLIAGEMLIHDGDPFFAWQAENCTVYTSPDEDIKVRKGPDKSKKIDAIIALINAIACIDEGEDVEHEIVVSAGVGR